ncbi:MAG: hypothetical protein PSV40_01685 [Polaromonas sp.]|uniref:hypothetical protein n=1 Tax=Polaromonas sp. TaxID=1869339 RepID=UPI0024872C9C|nr:hypothetical protein [Polaromonas sp.]MDI1267802.1 hypothetical protein [Polaromonas sp.]
MSEETSAYEQGINRLIEYVRKQTNVLNPTQRKNALVAFATRLNALARDLETHGMAQGAIEEEHDQAPDVFCSYAATLRHMRELAESAQRAAASLPDARKRFAMPAAALGLVHLRHAHGYKRPVLSNTSADVKELARVCKAAGLIKSDEALRGALAAGLNAFDPYYVPPWVDEVVGELQASDKVKLTRKRKRAT